MTGPGGRTTVALDGFVEWLACCLGRGDRAPMSPKDLAALAAEVGEQRFAGGTLVFREGEPAAQIHILRQGSLELTRTVGGRTTTVQVLGAGDVFGDVPALLGEQQPFDARAVEDCVVLSMDATALLELLAAHPRLMGRWIISLADRMSGLQHRLIDVLAGGLEAQLASVLLRRADGQGRVTTSQSQLASLLGVQRTSVQRVLKKLDAEGLVEVGYRRIRVRDRSGLAALLGGVG